MARLQEVPPNNLQSVIDYINNGGRVCVPTHTRMTIIDKKSLIRWEKAGYQLLKERGNGYQMGHGKSSVYILPGQLKFIIED